MNAGAQILNNFQMFIVNPAIILLFTAGLLLFLYGLMIYINRLRSGGDTKDGVQHMLWGIIGMFIMASSWSIIKLIEEFIGSDPRQPDVGRLQNIQATQFKMFGPPK